jgi:hypothetical protein
MLLQHLKRRATQVDLPLILGTTGILEENSIGDLSSSNLSAHTAQLNSFTEIEDTSTTGFSQHATIHINSNNSTSLKFSLDKTTGRTYAPGIIMYESGEFTYNTSISPSYVFWAIDTNNGTTIDPALTLDNGFIQYENIVITENGSRWDVEFFFSTIKPGRVSLFPALVDTTGSNANPQVGSNNFYDLRLIEKTLQLPVLQNSTDYKLDIDWGDGNIEHYEGAGSDLFGNSFTYTEDAFPDVGVFNADVPTDYTTWIDFFDPAGGARFPTVNGNTLTETLSNLYQAAAKKFIYDKTYKFTTVSLNVKKEVATNDEVFGFRIQKDSTVNNDDIYGDATISKEDGTIYSQSGWEELTVVDNGSSLTINGTVMANTNTSSLVILPAIGFTYSPLTFVATGSITINSIELKAYTQPDIKIWARNGADNNLNFNRTSWLTHGDTLIQEGDMSKEPLDISIDANQNGIPDDWE